MSRIFILTMNQMRNPVNFPPSNHPFPNVQYSRPPQHHSMSPEFRPLPNYRNQQTVNTPYVPPPPPHKQVNPPQMYQTQPQMGFSSPVESNKDKFKEMTDDLARLKNQLNTIMSSNNDIKKNAANFNKTVDSKDFLTKNPAMKPLSANLQANFNNLSSPNIHPPSRIAQPKETEFQFRHRSPQPYFQYQKEEKPSINEKPKLIIKNESEQKKVAPFFNPNKKLATKREQLEEKKVVPLKNDGHLVMPVLQQRVEKTTEREKNEEQWKVTEKNEESWKRQLRQFELKTKNKELEKENCFLKDQNKLLQKQIKDLKQKLSSQERSNLKLKQSNENLLKAQKQLNRKIQDLENTNKELKTNGNSSFNHILVNQLEESNKFKDIIERKNEEIEKLIETIYSNKKQIENLESQFDILKLKHKTEINKIEQNSDIKNLNLTNENKNLKHAMETLEAKLQVAIRDNKSKDQFLQQHLVGRIKTGEEQDYVKKMLEKYIIQFPVNKLKEKLLEEEAQIRRLKGESK